MHGTVKVWQEQVELPTYGTGEQDSHPMFLETASIRDRPVRFIPMALLTP